MRLDIRSLPLVLAVFFLPSACGSADRATSAAPKPEGAGSKSPDVIAMVDGQPIKRAAFEDAVAKASFEVRQQYYDLQRQIVDQMILDSLLEKEAKARGITVASLRKAEVDDKVKAITPDDIHKFYEAQKAQMGGRPEEQMRGQIEAYLRGQRQNDAREAFESSLKRKANVQIQLDPPRQVLDFPKDAPSVGPATAPVTIVEYTDYQCPYCARAQATIDEILTQYGDKVRLVPRDFPLEFHSRALYASRAVHCATEQKKFWEYHTDLLRHPSDLSDADLERRASALGLDAGAFKTCVASDHNDAAIRASQDAGTKANVRGTPSFFINGRFLNGALAKSSFSQVIDDELSRVASK